MKVFNGKYDIPVFSPYDIAIVDGELVEFFILQLFYTKHLEKINNSNTFAKT